MLTPHQTKVVDYFHQTAADYERLWKTKQHHGLHCGYFDDDHRSHSSAILNMNRVLSEWAEITASDHVIDAGCGIGGSSLWLAEHTQATVTGVNITPGQLAEARTLADTKGLSDRVSFHEADFANTRLPDACCDVVWALESMCYAESKADFLKEAFRLLKPGGRLIIADGFLTRESLTEQEQKIVDRWCAGWMIPHVTSHTHFARLLSETGFESAQFRDITWRVVPSSNRIYCYTLLFYPFAKLATWCRLRTPLQTQGISSGYYQYHARKRGLGLYGIFFARKPAE